jgi:YfiR/HmsC-like
VETIKLTIVGYPRSKPSIRATLFAGSQKNRVGVWIPLFLILFVPGISSSAQPMHPTEPQVKAAYLYNFGKFVRWESAGVGNSDSLGICILGKDPFGSVLDSTVAGESIEGKKITVKRLAKIQEANQCSILFIGSSEESRLAPILSAAQRSGMLTVSDIPHFAEDGGIIGFITQQGKIRFEVNREAAEQSHVVLSSELLKVAGKVIDKGGR